jgi:hypothetical protein
VRDEIKACTVPTAFTTSSDPGWSCPLPTVAKAPLSSVSIAFTLLGCVPAGGGLAGTAPGSSACPWVRISPPLTLIPTVQSTLSPVVKRAVSCAAVQKRHALGCS